MFATFGKILAGGFVFSVIFSMMTAHAPPDDPRYTQIVQCEVAIKARLDDPASAQMPNFLLRPGSFTRGENNAFEPIETFDFSAKNANGAMTRYGAYCAYGLDGRVAAADIE